MEGKIPPHSPEVEEAVGKRCMPEPNAHTVMEEDALIATDLNISTIKYSKQLIYKYNYSIVSRFLSSQFEGLADQSVLLIIRHSLLITTLFFVWVFEAQVLLSLLHHSILHFERFYLQRIPINVLVYTEVVG